ncbi:MAG TPA: hypothetical protein VEL31_27880 [Ktedonobacteraceae bacterium]|nr:hypothetical protein [Ktedonobacteraceae bacterium]
MTISPERCSQLRKLHAQLTTQIQLLRENMEKEEREGVDTSLEALNTLKILQSSLRKVTSELEQCPSDIVDTASSAAPRVSAPKSNRYFFPEEERAQEGQRVDDEYE